MVAEYLREEMSMEAANMMPIAIVATRPDRITAAHRKSKSAGMIYTIKRPDRIRLDTGFTIASAHSRVNESWPKFDSGANTDISSDTWHYPYFVYSPVPAIMRTGIVGAGHPIRLRRTGRGVNLWK